MPPLGQGPDHAVLLGHDVDLAVLVLAEAQVGARRVDQLKQRDRLAVAEQRQFVDRRLPAELEVGDVDVKDRGR